MSTSAPQAQADGRRSPERRASASLRLSPAEHEALLAQAAELEAALNRFRAWYRQRGAEEARLVAQLNHFRALTEKGVQKANALSAKLTGIRLKLQEQTQKETPHGDE